MNDPIGNAVAGEPGCASSLALSVVMSVAILTAKLHDVHALGDFFYLPEPAYIVIFLWLFFVGGGKVSVDEWIARRMKAGGPGVSSSRWMLSMPVLPSSCEDFVLERNLG